MMRGFGMMTSYVYFIGKKAVGLFAASALLGLSAQALAADFYGDAYGFSASGAPSGATSMRVTGPKGFAVESDSLSYNSDQLLPNGTYKYEIHGAVSLEDSAVDVKHKMNQGRSASAKRGRKATGVIDSGHFRIKSGEVYIGNKNKKEK